MKKHYLDFTKPNHFMSISKYILPLLGYSTLTLFIATLLMGLVTSPCDAQQGENYRIIYIHVPSAWICMLLYMVITIGSVLFLLYKHPLIAAINYSLGKTGAIFTLITLVTGSLWGFPMWGTFWVWDARLTSVLILFFIYMTYLSIIVSSKFTERGHRTASIVAIIGFVNIPIIKYSVEWWSTLHQAASITQSQNQIHIAILIPMILSLCTFILYSIYVTILHIRIYITTNKLSTVQQ
jgi:heme exporter protein C